MLFAQIDASTDKAGAKIDGNLSGIGALRSGGAVAGHGRYDQVVIAVAVEIARSHGCSELGIVAVGVVYGQLSGPHAAEIPNVYGRSFLGKERCGQ